MVSKVSTNTNYFLRVPEDLLKHFVLNFIPLQSLTNFQLTCKRFHKSVVPLVNRLLSERFSYPTKSTDINLLNQIHHLAFQYLSVTQSIPTTLNVESVHCSGKCLYVLEIAEFLDSKKWNTGQMISVEGGKTSITKGITALTSHTHQAYIGTEKGIIRLGNQVLYKAKSEVTILKVFGNEIYFAEEDMRPPQLLCYNLKTRLPPTKIGAGIHRAVTALEVTSEYITIAYVDGIIEILHKNDKRPFQNFNLTQNLEIIYGCSYSSMPRFITTVNYSEGKLYVTGTVGYLIIYDGLTGLLEKELFIGAGVTGAFIKVGEWIIMGGTDTHAKLHDEIDRGILYRLNTKTFKKEILAHTPHPINFLDYKDGNLYIGQYEGELLICRFSKRISEKAIPLLQIISKPKKTSFISKLLNK